MASDHTPYKLKTAQSAFPLRPSLGKLNTEAGGCIKVRSGKLLNKLDISYGCINLDSAPSNFNRHFLAYFCPFSRMGYLRSIFRDEGWHPMIWRTIFRRCLVVDHQPTSFEGFPESPECGWCVMPEGGIQHKVEIQVRIAQHLLLCSHEQGSSSQANED